MKKVLLTSQSGVLRKVASQTQGPEITLTSTQNKQNIPNSKLVPGSSRLASSHVVGLRRSSCLLSEILLLNLSFGPSFSVYFTEILASHISFSYYLSVCIVFGSGFNGGPWIRIRNQEGKHDPPKRKS
jgi:hypothetical protein